MTGLNDELPRAHLQILSENDDLLRREPCRQGVFSFCCDEWGSYVLGLGGDILKTIYIAVV